jgi:hypothetical protein
MRTVTSIITVLVSALLALPAAAAPLDGSQPLLCAVTEVNECSGGWGCERSTSDLVRVPPFVRVDVQRRLLLTVDGGRTSPIAAFQRTDGRLMLQGMQAERVWGLVVDESNGEMSATVAEADGAIVLSGTCIVP